MTKYKAYFFLPWPANSSMVTFEVTQCDKHDSDEDFTESLEQLAKSLNMMYVYKEEVEE